MLYNKKNTPKLDMELFKNPTSEYRGAPFWGWNCELDEKELLRQIDIFEEMGFGGFHIHPRSGMRTKYLGEKYMQLVKSCLEKAKEKNMLCWLYDEDRWASGSGGGYVTSIKKYRQRTVLFTVNKREDCIGKEEAIENGKPYLLNIFDIVLNPDGTLKSYKAISDETPVEGKKWYAYSANPRELGWYNYNTYVDTLNPEAIKKFIDVTHEAYFKEVGEEFGKAIPSIFTDEPATSDKDAIFFSHSDMDVTLSWTHDLDESFMKEYGFNIVDYLPELVWNLENDQVSFPRYAYHNHVSKRMTNAFIKQMGDWCNEHGLYLTGHMAEEDSLIMQSRLVGEEMRAYPHFGIPGIDMLCNKTSYTALKQAQSVVHQYGKEGMMAEHCGVTNWDFDFRGHKFHIDWLMALGVTARAHHGSWVSAKGVAKRDYPASINYHSPWYKEYSHIENHASRLATVLTRGKSVVKVGVIHPIESMWVLFGAHDTAGYRQKSLEENFQNVTKWLLFGGVDFDFISEELLESIYGGSENGKFSVGEMQYDTVIVPDCITLHKGTVEKLEQFTKNGGKVVFMGACPEYIDAKKSDFAKALYEKACCIPFDKTALLSAVESERFIEIKNSLGYPSENFLYQLRENGDRLWLFIAHGIDGDDHGNGEEVQIKLKGAYKCTLFDTVTGDSYVINHTIRDGYTFIKKKIYACNSLLLCLEKTSGNGYCAEEEEKEIVKTFDIKEKVTYKREEDNVYILDMAQYSEDGIAFSEKEENLRIDKALREKYGYPKATGEDIQPWAMEDDGELRYIWLKYDILSEVDYEGAHLACEEIVSASFNGEEIKLSDCGWYFDVAIRRYPLPKINKGKNELLVKVPFTKSISLENMYILGDFDVRADGVTAVILPKSENLAFGSIVGQGMPFYGGNVSYISQIETPQCSLQISVPHYKGALVKVFVDGEDKGIIAYSPYKVTIDNLAAGKHEIEFKFYGNRFNTFAPLHNCGDMTWAGPNAWFTTGSSWCYEYNLKPTGIMASPVFTILK